MILLTIFSLLLIFATSCKKEDTKETPTIQAPDDIVIHISDNSVYNQGNFRRSFEQLFVSELLPMIGYSHVYDEVFRLISSSLNYPFFGDVGKGVHTYEHQYDENKVIVKTVRSSADPGVRELEYEYEYDEIGQISKLTKISNGNIRDIVELKYDEDGFLIEKNHIEIKGIQSAFIESFEIISGKIESYTRQTNKTEYTYNNNLVEQMTYYFNDEMYGMVTFEYDTYNRLISTSGDDDFWNETYHYSDGSIEMRIYIESFLYVSFIIYDGMVYGSETIYFYTETIEFDYAIRALTDENGNQSEFHYLEGSLENLSIEGKSLVTEWYRPSYVPLRQEYSDKSDELLYVCSNDIEEYPTGGYDVTNVQWFDASGMEIEESEIEEEWVFKLSLLHSYRSETGKSEKNQITQEKWSHNWINR